MSTDTATAIREAFGFKQSDAQPRPQPKPDKPEPQQLSLAQQIYSHLIPNQKGSKR